MANYHFDRNQTRPEDAIRQLRDGGADPQATKVTADTLEFNQQNGPPPPGREREYALALGQFLQQRGHRVNYT